MGRKPRTIYSGALYHIIQRGNNRNYIYEEIRDKKMFFSVLLDAKKVCEFQILYYVLMDNHYHLIIEAGETPVWKGVQRLNTSYSKYYNKKYNRTGGIYEGRHSASLISDTKYYYQLIRYIAQNPVRANIAKEPREYLWSAHQAICANDHRIVDIHRTLSYFPGPQSISRQQYMDLVEADREINSEYDLVLEKEHKKIKDALDHLIDSLDYSDSVSLLLKQGDKRKEIQEERNDFINAAHRAGFSPKEIAGYLSYSAEGIRKVLRLL